MAAPYTPEQIAKSLAKLEKGKPGMWDGGPIGWNHEQRLKAIEKILAEALAKAKPKK